MDWRFFISFHGGEGSSRGLLVRDALLLHLHLEDGSSKVLRNAGIPQKYTASQTRSQLK
jgi:hypothetical protein